MDMYGPILSRKNQDTIIMMETPITSVSWIMLSKKV